MTARTLDELAAQLQPYDEVESSDRLRDLAATTACPECGVTGRRPRTFVHRDRDERSFLVCVNGCGHMDEV